MKPSLIILIVVIVCSTIAVGIYMFTKSNEKLIAEINENTRPPEGSSHNNYKDKDPTAIDWINTITDTLRDAGIFDWTKSIFNKNKKPSNNITEK